MITGAVKNKVGAIHDERLLNPYSLLWIAAALGADRDIVLTAGFEMEKYKTFREKCGVVRKHIPWETVYELAVRTQSQQNASH